MSIHATITAAPDGAAGLDQATYDQALARATQLSLPAESRPAKSNECSIPIGAWPPQATMLRAYRRVLVHAIEQGLTIVLAPCACVSGLNTYHALPRSICLRELARRQALAVQRPLSQR